MQKTKNYLSMFIISLLLISACGKEEQAPGNNTLADENTAPKVNFRIEFIELGSVNCIPCRQMQPVMKSIETKYKGKVKVTFYDVWKDGAPAAKYNLELIPTQIFLDSAGKEISRHQGFYAEEDIDKFLKSQGVNIPD